MSSRFARLGEALRWLRLRRALAQREVAAAAGVSVPVVSRIESGRHPPTLELLDRLLAALDCDLLDLALASGVAEERFDLPLRLPESLSEEERGALKVSFYGFQEFVRAAAKRVDRPGPR